MKAPYTRFGQTKMVDVNVHLNGKQLQEVFEWDEDYWICRPEEWYVLDGGNDYIRCSINTVPPEDLTLYADDPHEKIREVFIWKSYGKNFSQPEGVYTLLKDLADEHIEAILETQTHLPDYILEMFKNEQLFRKEKENERKMLES